MSEEVPDLGELSELFQDLSVQLRRLKVRQDGEPRVSASPGWDDIPETVRAPDSGARGERGVLQGGRGEASQSSRGEGDVLQRGPDGRGQPAAGPYKAALQGPAAYFVTPVSSRSRVMAADGGI